VLKDARQTFTELVSPHLGSAYRLARGLTGSAADAEDIVQDASIRAFKALASYGGDNSRAWFLAITRNTTYTFLARKRSRLLVLSGEDATVEHRLDREPDPGATPEARLIAETDGKALEAALAALSPPLREVIVLREYSDLSYKDIADMTKLPLGTVMSRLARARAELLRLLTQTSTRESPR
jgi:RNA polymerase sigma factor (sigma-70 family)